MTVNGSGLDSTSYYADPSVINDPGKDPTVPGSLVSPTAGGTVNWEPPAFSPDTGLFYVSERNGISIFYLTSNGGG